MSAPILDAVALVREGFETGDDEQVQQGLTTFSEAVDALVQAVLELDDRELRRVVS